MRIALIIPAAGASRRFGGRDKLSEDLAGRPVLQRTLELFTKRDDVASIIVAGPNEEDAFSEFSLRHGDKLSLFGAILVRGGREHRYETVRAALEHVPDDATHIAVHDAARPATPPDLIDRIFDAARAHTAVIPAIAVADTLKRLDPERTVEAATDPADAILGGTGKSEKLRVVKETVPRDDLVGVQTPQIFEADLLRKAYAQSDLDSTDDAGLIERLAETVAVVEGDPRNIKITRPHDIPVVMAIMGLRAPAGRATHKKF